MNIFQPAKNAKKLNIQLIILTVLLWYIAVMLNWPWWSLLVAFYASAFIALIVYCCVLWMMGKFDDDEVQR